MIAQIRVDAADREVHGRHFPRGRIGLLAVHGDVVNVALMAFDEVRGLYEHAAAAAARIVHSPVVGFDDFDQRLHDARGCVELAGVLALRFGEFGQTIFVGASEDVAAIALFGHLHVGEQVHDFAQTSLVELLACEVLRQDALELVVLGLDLAHGLVDGLADLGRVRGRCDGLPAGALGNEEDVLTRVFVAVLLEALSLLNEFLVFLVELVGDVLQEDEAEHDVLVFGSVDVAAQLVGSAPDLFLEADLGGIVLLLCHVLYYPPARPIR